MTVHPFIEAEKQSGHNVKRACELLQVSRAAFYARRTGTPGPRAVRDAELTEQITQIHEHSRGNSPLWQPSWTSGCRSAAPDSAGTTHSPSPSSPPSNGSCSTRAPGPAGPPLAPRSLISSRAGTTCIVCTAASATAVPPTTRPHSQPDHHTNGVRQSGTSSTGKLISGPLASPISGPIDQGEVSGRRHAEHAEGVPSPNCGRAPPRTVSGGRSGGDPSGRRGRRARSGRMSGPVDETWTGPGGIAAGEPRKMARPLGGGCQGPNGGRGTPLILAQQVLGRTTADRRADTRSEPEYRSRT